MMYHELVGLKRMREEYEKELAEERARAESQAAKRERDPDDRPSMLPPGVPLRR